MELNILIDNIISLFIIILVGFYASKKKIITPNVNSGLIEILIQIVLPFMILSSFIFTYDDTVKSNVIKTIYYSLGTYIIMIVASYILLLPIKKDKKTILHFANVFTNTGYVGFPVLYSIYGAEGVVYGSVFNMFFVFLLWTYGLFIFNGNMEKMEIKQELKKIILNPSIIAALLGIIILIFNLTLPSFIITSIKSIGNITGPLSMIIIGVILSKIKILKYIRDLTLYYGLATKLLIIPFLIILLSLLFEGPSEVENTVIIMSAMPASAMTSIFAEKYHIEKDYAAVYVSVSTLLSLITTTVIIKIII